MRRAAWTAAICAVTFGATGISGRQAGSVWPPAVQAGPTRSEPLPADEALRTIVMPPGYRVELVAAEPMVQDPVWIDADADGRLWVVEMRGFMPDNEASGEREPTGRISVLEDTDDDGRADRRTVFLDGLVLPRSVKALEHGILIVEPPNLWLARDTDGDLRADTKERLRDDFGRADGNPEHNANGLLWGLDNWIHTSEHDGFLRLHRGRWEHRPTLFRGQWGLSMDDLGRVYRNWNEVPLFVDLVPAGYFRRNPHAVRTRGVYEPAMPADELVIWPIRPTRGVNRGYRDGLLRPDGSLTTYVSAGTPTIYRGDRLPAGLRGNAFVTEPAGNLVHRLVVEEDGAGGIRARNAYQRGEFLASTDERFRPVNLLSAPDGTLYVVDMYRGVIQHRQYQSEYLRSYIRQHGLEQPTGYGRIYRVVHETTRRDGRPSLSTAPAATLVDHLSHPNGWWRDTAQRLLVERGEIDVAPRLRTLAVQADDARTRLHAFWTLEGLGQADETTVGRGLEDPSPHVRAAAIRLAEPWLARPGHPLASRVLALAGDTAPEVRRQLALSLGALPGASRRAALVELLVRYGEDPVVVDSAVSSADRLEMTLLEDLVAATTGGARRADAVAMLAGAIGRAARQAEIRGVLELAGDRERPHWVREALLAGLERAWTGRTGPMRAAGARRAPLAERPDALVAIAESGEPLAAAAARVLDAVDWPGRPRTTPEVPPLDAAARARFAAGEAIYQRTCAACHRPDGQGIPNVAPPLAGSAWVLGRAGLAARILLNGKEG
ncbi:MAG TPA: c-type cytochrome, partial [Methylomirabilota bacterium]